MSYGMHDYLAEKAMQRQYMQKYAAGETKEDLSAPPTRGLTREKLLPFFLAPFELAAARRRYKKLDVGNSIKPGTVRGKLNPDKTNEEPGKQQSLRDVILAHVLDNKYTYGGAVGAGGAGAAIGALSSDENRLRNALLGGGIGAILGGVSGHIADRFIG